MYYVDGSYKEISFSPAIEDLEYLRTFKFVDLTFRGTIEFRSVCCQSITDVMTVASFHLGLKNQSEKEPLFERIRQQVNPALQMLEQLKAEQNIEDIILEYGSLGLETCSE